MLAFLGINAWTDLKKRQVSLVLVGIFAAASLLWNLRNGEISWEYLIPVGIGGFLLAVSFLTKGALGMGDGWLMAALGLGLNTGEFLAALFVGMLCCALWAVVLMTVFRRGKHTEIPFVPFLLLGYVGGVLLWK